MQRRSHVWLVVLSCLFFITASICTTIWVLNEWNMELNLRGDSNITLEVGSVYHEYGAHTEASGTLLPFLASEPEVKIRGEVDTDTVGTYTLYYRADYRDAFVEKMRTIHVVDTEKPVISLRYKEDYYTLPGHPYKEEGFTAWDNYDGDITNKVEHEENDGTVTYRVKDSSGNETMETREIVYDDRDAPELTLEGGDFTLPLGTEYEEPGFSAIDNADGDITDRVQVEGDIDIYLEGNYPFTYTVQDTWGNESKAERIVTVKKMKPEHEGEKLVYLTFDDGPGPYTARLLDILDKYHVKATFFVTNQFPGDQDMIAEEARRGHAVGVHTYSHVFETVYEDEDAYWADFEKMQDIIEAQTGSRTKLMRFPGGSSNEISKKIKKGIMSRLTVQAEQKGYTYFDWNVSSGDAGQTKDSKKIAQNILDGIASHNTSVVLCHDIHEYTVDAMEEMLKKALKDGYSFEVLEPDSYSAHHAVNN